jgi:sulfide:quinone oxidoreductase
MLHDRLGRSFPGGAGRFAGVNVMRRRIIVLGASFAGLTAALQLGHHLGRDHDVIVVSRSDQFVFLPSLIWVPFGLRTPEEISFSVPPLLEARGITFRRGTVTRLEPEARRVIVDDQTLDYDFLVIATGPRPHYGGVPGLGPHQGHTSSIYTLDEALAAQRDYVRLLEAPGPAIVGVAPGSSCFPIATEFALNLAHQLARRGKTSAAPVTFVTPEPFLGHFGIGGFGRAGELLQAMFDKAGITTIVDAAITRVTPGTVELEDGRRLPFRFATILPQLRGIEPVRAVEAITTPSGFVQVDPLYRTEAYPEIHACGVAVHIPPPGFTRVPCAVPRTGYLSEEMARVVAYNIAATIHGRRPVALPPSAIDAKYVLDAGNTGLIMSSDHFLEPRDHAWLIPGPEAHWAKVAFEKYFLATRRRGIV